MKCKAGPGSHEITLTYQQLDNATNEIKDVERVFHARTGEYVQEKVEGKWMQVFQSLEKTGETLTLPPAQTLGNVIRREFRRMKEEDARSVYPKIVSVAGRPRGLEGGKTISMYLDASSLAAAESLGAGNISAGVRLALVPHLNAASDDTKQPV